MIVGDAVLFTAAGGTRLGAAWLDGPAVVVVGRGAPMSLARWEEVVRAAGCDVELAAERAALEVGGTRCFLPVALGSALRAQLEEAACSASASAS